MKKRYRIAHNDKKNTMVITEFMEWEKAHNIMCEEEYEWQDIGLAVSEGVNAVIAAFRTPNFYPTTFASQKISDSIISFYESFEAGEQISETVVDIDDADVFKEAEAEEAMLDSLADDLPVEDSEDLDEDEGFLNEEEELEGIVVPKSSDEDNETKEGEADESL